MLLKGIPVSPGYAIGSVLFLEETIIDYSKKIVDHPEDEIKRYHQAIDKTKSQLEALIQSTKKLTHPESASILSSHLAVLLDPEVKKAVEHKIVEESCNLIYAIKRVADDYIKQFNEIQDLYLRERVTDLIDVTERVIKNALNIALVDLSLINHEVILVAKDLKPSQAAQMNKKYIKGFVTQQGGKTSHSTIIAKLMGIPAIVGIKNLFEHVINGEEIILDGTKGEIHLNFDDSMKSSYQHLIDQTKSEKQSLKSFIKKKTVTKDGKEIELHANIGSNHDLPYVMDNDAEGIGLFRTELLFMDRLSMPSEDEQFEVYKDVLETMYPKPVTIRTIDIGGDKYLPYLHQEAEANPFLGKRAIRLCFDQVDFFKVQLRALLRASVHGNLKIMFPMIATKDEFLDAKDIVSEVQEELIEKNIPYHIVDLGVMIEIPAAALTADDLANAVDFFSIGTNDLIQYTFAADRNHESLGYLYQPFSPSIIKLISMVCEAAKDHKIPVSVCGEMASDLNAIPLLIGLGVDHLSMNPESILKARQLIKDFDSFDLSKLAKKALHAHDQQEVLDLVQLLKDEYKK
ncbi:MAG: phosphoenolpyruvate--protein phosphotransferase [Acholeplasmataceae bacterium]